MILIFWVMLFFFNVLPSISQERSVLDSLVSYKAKNISLHDGLNEIGKNVGFEFSYNSDLIASNTKIKANYENIPLRILLRNLVDDSTLIYNVIDKQIVITKRNRVAQLISKNSFIEGNLLSQIKGVVYDKFTGEKMAFANVSVLGKSKGTVTNENGDFTLKISSENLFDTLAISYIGYKNTLVAIKELSVCNNRIYLEEDHFQIQEVVIRINNPEKILREALGKIKNNYYTDPYYITSFYREIIKNKDELAAITEAVLQVYKSPYLGLFSDQVKLIKSRKNEYFSKADTVSLKLKGGLYASLYLDVIKNPTYFLSEEYLHLFKYSIDGIVNFNNTSAYVIRFTPNRYLEDNTFEGEIYINTDDLAIVEVRFNITSGAIEQIGKSLIVKKAFRTKVKPTSAKYIINYRQINNRYFINLARGELDFKVKYKRKLFSTDYKTVFEFAANDIDTLDVERFSRVETIPQNDVFIDESYQYDQQFWGEYNYISPDESLEEALIRIKKRLEEQ